MAEDEGNKTENFSAYKRSQKALFLQLVESSAAQICNTTQLSLQRSTDLTMKYTDLTMRCTDLAIGCTDLTMRCTDLAIGCTDLTWVAQISLEMDTSHLRCTHLTWDAHISLEMHTSHLRCTYLTWDAHISLEIHTFRNDMHRSQILNFEKNY